MEIITLPWGILAPDESDCISVAEKGDGTYLLDTSSLGNCADDEESESTAVIGSEPYPSYDAAEAAGLAIAAEQCVETVYVSRQRANAT